MFMVIEKEMNRFSIYERSKTLTITELKVYISISNNMMQVTLTL